MADSNQATNMKTKISNKGKSPLLEQEKITAQTAGVRKTVFESMATSLSPARLGSILKEAKNGNMEAYLTLAEEMEEKDSQYRTVLNTRKLQVVSTPYYIKSVEEKNSASSTKSDENISLFLNKVINTPQFKKMMFHLLDGLGKGFSVVEVNYAYNEKDKMIYPKNYSHKPPQWFTFDTNLENLLLRVDDQGATTTLDNLKVIKHVPQLKSGLPTRGGLAFAAASIFILKNYGVKDWGALIEVFGMPIRIGKYDQSATDTDRTKLLQAVSDIGVDFAAIIPQEMQIEFIDAKVNSNGDLYRNYINYLDEQISKIVLGQTMTTHSGSSLSQAQVHNEVRQIIQKADALDLADTINRDLIKPLIDLNFGEQEFYPFLEFDFSKEEDKSLLMNIYEKTHNMGIPFSISEFREKICVSGPRDNDKEDSSIHYKLSAPSEDTFLNSSYGNLWSNENLELNAEKQSNSDEIDLEVEEELKAYEEFMEPMVKEIENLLDTSKSIEEAISKMDNLKLNTEKMETSLLKSSTKEWTKVFKV
ncbi:DUF935 domain-containing protein [Candidatus Hepatincolaceae symbiont of Richtersius coronifer]